jgi:hypothetical protein
MRLFPQIRYNRYVDYIHCIPSRLERPPKRPWRMQRLLIDVRDLRCHASPRLHVGLPESSRQSVGGRAYRVDCRTAAASARA